MRSSARSASALQALSLLRVSGDAGVKLGEYCTVCAHRAGDLGKYSLADGPRGWTDGTVGLFGRCRPLDRFVPCLYDEIHLSDIFCHKSGSFLT